MTDELARSVSQRNGFLQEIGTEFLDGEDSAKRLVNVENTGYQVIKRRIRMPRFRRNNWS